MDIIMSVTAFLSGNAVKSFLASYFAEKGLDFAVEKGISFTKTARVLSLEEELLAALNDALRDTCESIGWEYDARAMFETFMSGYQESWNAVVQFSEENLYREILAKALGHPIEEPVFEYWCYSVGSSISDEKYKHLNNFIVNWKLNQLTVIIQDWADNGRTGQGKALPACMTSLKDEEILDLSAALMKHMDKLFPPSISGAELTERMIRPRADANDYFPWIQSLPPEQRILFEDEMHLLYFSKFGHSFDVRGAIEDGTLNRRLDAGPLFPILADQDCHEDESIKDVCQMKEIADPDSEMMGIYFSLYEQSNTKTVIYQIDKVALPGEHRWIFYPERLDSTIEFLDGVCDGTTCYEFGTKKRTFYVDYPAPEGNPVAIFHFIEGKGVMMNMGFLGGDRFLISKTPVILNYKKAGRADSIFNDSNIEHFGGYSAFQVCEEMEYDYSSLGNRRIVILDTDTTEEVRPYFDSPGNKGKIKLTLHKKYMSFEIRSKYKHDPSMSDYEIGCAYRYGTYRLKRNYEKALYYFRLAEAAGDVRAKAELVKMYEKGMGCSQNPEVIKRLKREIQQISEVVN